MTHTLLFAVLEIPPPLSAKPGDQLRATATYIADNTQENSMHLVEGEKVYVQGQSLKQNFLWSYTTVLTALMNILLWHAQNAVIHYTAAIACVTEMTNSDWWFVKKHLTLEEGYVPAKLLAEEVSYTHYVEKKIEEKADKLPVFDSMCYVVVLHDSSFKEEHYNLTPS